MHPIIGPLYIQLDCYKALSDEGMPQVMHELLGKQDIVSDVMTTDKNPLLRTDQTKHDQLQPFNQNLNTYLVEGGAQIDRFEVFQNRCIRLFRDEND